MVIWLEGAKVNVKMSKCITIPPRQQVPSWPTRNKISNHSVPIFLRPVSRLWCQKIYSLSRKEIKGDKDKTRHIRCYKRTSFVTEREFNLRAYILTLFWAKKYPHTKAFMFLREKPSRLQNSEAVSSLDRIQRYLKLERSTVPIRGQNVLRFERY